MVDFAYVFQLIGGEEGYAEVLELQGGGCAICGRLQREGERAFHIDHDHSTGKLRGILCSGCNLGLGHFADDVDSLAEAIKYVEHYRSGHWTAEHNITPTLDGPTKRAKRAPKVRAKRTDEDIVPVRIVPGTREAS